MSLTRLQGNYSATKGVSLLTHETTRKTMTQLLEKAFAHASQLPDEEQDAIAALVLREIESERRWDEAFSRSQEDPGKIEPLS